MARFFRGLFFLIIGIGLTCFTYSMSTQTGVYFIYYGAIIGGIIDMIIGGIQWYQDYKFQQNNNNLDDYLKEYLKNQQDNQSK